MKKIFSFVAVLSVVVLVAGTFSLSSALGASGSIKTSDTNCASTNVNHYDVGDHVWLDVSGFDADASYDWDISPVPSGSPVASGNEAVDSNGATCFDAYTVQSGDSGEYKFTFEEKHDNYQVKAANLVDEVDEQGPTTGTIVVKKITLPGSDKVFHFDLNQIGFNLKAGLTYTSDPLTPGTYSVLETSLPGWTQTNVTCVSSNQDTETPGNISLQAGETVTCTFTNTKDPVYPTPPYGTPDNYQTPSPTTGTLTVTKVVNNGTSQTPKVIADFALKVDGNAVTSGVSGVFSAGAHVVSETPDANYTGVFTGDCDATGNVSVPAASSANCTLTNTFKEPQSCEAQTSSMDVISDTTNTDNEDGDAVELSFVHPGWANILGAKWIWATDPVASPTNDADLTYKFSKTFNIAGTPTNANLEWAADNYYVIKINNVLVTQDLTEFNYNPSHTLNVLSYLVNGSNTIEIEVTNKEDAAQSPDPAVNPAGLLYKLSLTQNACVPPPVDVCPNDPGVQTDEKECGPTTGHIIVDKVTNLPGSSQSFTFATTGTGYNGFNLTDLGTPNDQEVSAGTYSVLEGSTNGWMLSSAVCESSNDDSETPDEISLQGGETVTCTFTNTATQCSDGADNDNDDAIDSADAGCHTDGDAGNSSSYDPNDNDESNENGGGGPTPPGETECSDEQDNDSDGLIDAADPGCHTDEDASNSSSYNPGDDNEFNSNGGGGGGRNHNKKSGSNNGPQGLVAGAETSCGIYVDKFLRKGYPNDVETVKKVQQFLNDYMQAGLVVDGNYGSSTEAAVKAFQISHKNNILIPWNLTVPTGIFYLTTQTEVNNIMCPELGLPIPNPLIPFSLNSAVAKLSSFLHQ